MHIYYLKHHNGSMAEVIAPTLLNACKGMGWNVWDITLQRKTEITHFLLERHQPEELVKELC